MSTEFWFFTSLGSDALAKLDMKRCYACWTPEENVSSTLLSPALISMVKLIIGHAWNMYAHLIL